MTKKIALFRDSMTPIGIQEIPEYMRDYRVVYQEPLKINWEDLTENSCVQMWQEVFEPSGPKCPCCGIIPYCSTNYMQAPIWAKLVKFL